MQPDLKYIHGRSQIFLDLMDHVSQAASINRPVLVIGERGTGKELIASRLHYLSQRWNGPFQKMNCAALPETLLESELFGYEPGAFTGATKRRKGRFEMADGGSLFLDEIGTMSMAGQEKLLRVIEYGEFERVGGSETLKVDVRVIGATNIDLPAAANKGTFRLDLLDRLAFDVLTVPPLRVRPDDIPDLVEHFGTQMAQELEWIQFPGFTRDVMEAMIDYKWPGNVRELKNVVERALASAWDGEQQIDTVVFDPFDSPFRPGGDEMRHHDRLPPVADSDPEGKDVSIPLPTKERIGLQPLDFRSSVKSFQRDVLENAMEATRFNQRLAAKHLSLSYDQLRHALKKHDLL